MSPYVRAVFIEGDIPDIVTFVFYGPMPAIEGEELFRGGFWGGQAGNEVRDFASYFTGLEILRMPFDAGDLSTRGEIQIVVQIGGGPDFSDFQASMSFVQRFMLRGGSPRSIRGKRWRLSWSAGCP